ncbi:hypothetical protein WR25_05319 [Diploscapter pachys]|uniref:Bromodomain adjacent to zinc finger domain protein 2B n=1 Tax=Diploscapter pachys TaxID=2018661 RepID=A0A2A2LF89_9BILA|nr:hypothetical protein WR25_05319 [Diploscapter pachys]
MADQQNALLRLLAAQAAQMSGLGSTATSSAASSNSLSGIANGLSAASSTSNTSTSSSASRNRPNSMTPQQQAALLQQMAAFSTMAAMNPMMGMGAYGASPEMMMWQTMMAQAQIAQLQQQATAQAQQKQQQQQQQQASFDEVLKKLAENIKKSNAANNTNSAQKPSTSGTNKITIPSPSVTATPATPAKPSPAPKPVTSISSSPSATVAIKEGTSLNSLIMPKATPPKQDKPKPTQQSVMNKNMLDNAIWQLYATQLLQQSLAKAQQQAAQNGHKNLKNSSTGIANDQLIKAAELAAGTSKTGTPSPSASLDLSNSKKCIPTETQLRVPLKHGWRRQTFVRSLTPSGVRGDVIYYTPCGKRISNYAEVIRYLMKTPQVGSIGRDNFAFSGKMIVGEFLYPREKANGEKCIDRLTEQEVYDEIMKMYKTKPPMKNGDRRKETPVRDGISRFSPDDSFEPECYEEIQLEAYDDEDKIKWSREPCDDLLLTETRPLPELSRIENLALDGNAFANALMVHEFVQNFAHVLSIDLAKVPSLSDLCAGLAGDKKHFDSMMNLVKTLFALVLEYPGLPNGRKGKTKLGQSLQEVGMKRENYSEIMRMFLHSRDEQGKKLSVLLDTSSFECLSGENKAEILAYICNELLCCRNIVKEIDSNLEEVSKLKGERWMREGKARVLKLEQKKKRKLTKLQNKEEKEGDEKTEENGIAENGRASDSDGSRPATPQKDKKFTPGLGQCEILTLEEEKMTPEELEVQIGVLYKESAVFKRQIDDLNRRVRTFPFGWDRFHRQYWQLKNTPVIVVEAAESGGVHNPACNMGETCNKDPASISADRYVDPDVVACVEDLIDQVVLTRANIDKKKRRRYRRMENPFKRGWWTISSKQELESLKSSLHGRGIRERALHRLLCKNWFLKDIKLGPLKFDRIGPTVNTPQVEAEVRYRVMKAIKALRKKVADSKLQVSNPNEINGNEMVNGEVIELTDDWSHHEVGSAPSLEDLKTAILNTEQLIERKYLRNSFYANEPHPVAKILGLEKKEPESEKGEDEEEMELDETNEKEQEDNEEKEKEDTDDREMIEIWRSYIQEATTLSQLMLAVQCLDSSIAWERSITQARCQICKTQEFADRMLLCDQCEMGYHMHCFRPILATVPEGNWYCPRCKENASGKPTCVLCCKDGAPIYPCKKCSNFYHIECTREHIPESISEYICAGCDMKKFERKVIMRGESEERENHQNQNPENADPERDLKRGAKRKAEPPQPVVFPNEMNNDLCRAMLDEMETHHCAGPFMEPVDLELVVGYKDVIANPIDLSTIRNRIEANFYEGPEDFAADMELMFNNCRTFNEDDSPVGVAGTTLHKFYQKRWRQLKYNYSKRLKRMKH